MYSRVSFNRCLVQLEGTIVRCPIELLQSEFRHSEYVRDLFVSYSETLLSQVQQSVACNAMHSTEERMCRWLLMMHDRAEGEALPYTHEFLSHMLGANRKSVTLAARSLQTAGLISYRGEDSSSRSCRPRKGIVRVLRRRKGAVRCLLDTALSCGSGRYKRAAQDVKNPGAYRSTGDLLLLNPRAG
jgi:cAMP-binding proteins - catabolite gene activator and regulatory subunit of cAMP-dependent protein kinases